jgi:ABC-type multidrug transport system ATPase subunit
MRVGVTGHQGLDVATERQIRSVLGVEISRRGTILGVSSLAEGADQLFAEEVLRHGGTLLAVIPCASYEQAFQTEAARMAYARLREQATEVVELAYETPGEEAYWAAGRRVVDLADEILAVWDGEKSGGLGGTADVVGYARQHGVPVSVVWPSGSSRA